MIADEAQSTATSADTTALRLILQIACLSARERRHGSSRDADEDTNPSSSSIRSEPGASSAPSSCRFGDEDVMVDNLGDDLDQLVGAEELEKHLPPEVLDRYVEVCKQIKFVQPAAARTSIDRLLTWACQVWRSTAGVRACMHAEVMQRYLHACMLRSCMHA